MIHVAVSSVMLFKFVLMQFPDIYFHNSALVYDYLFRKISMTMLDETYCCKRTLSATSLLSVLHKSLIKVIFSRSVL